MPFFLIGQARTVVQSAFYRNRQVGRQGISSVIPTSRTLPTCLAMNERLAKYCWWGDRCASMVKGTRICPAVTVNPFAGNRRA